MFNALCLLASSAILFYVLKYRVHVHVTYTPTKSRRFLGGSQSTSRSRERARESSAMVSGREPLPPPKSAVISEFVPVASASPEQSSGPIACDRSTTRAARLSDLQSALVNLGAKKDRARRAAEHVLRNWPDLDFDAQIRAAVNEVQAA